MVNCSLHFKALSPLWRMEVVAGLKIPSLQWWIVLSGNHPCPGAHPSHLIRTKDTPITWEFAGVLGALCQIQGQRPMYTLPDISYYCRVSSWGIRGQEVDSRSGIYLVLSIAVWVIARWFQLLLCTLGKARKMKQASHANITASTAVLCKKGQLVKGKDGLCRKNLTGRCSAWAAFGLSDASWYWGPLLSPCLVQALENTKWELLPSLIFMFCI